MASRGKRQGVIFVGVLAVFTTVVLRNLTESARRSLYLQENSHPANCVLVTATIINVNPSAKELTANLDFDLPLTIGMSGHSRVRTEHLPSAIVAAPAPHPVQMHCKCPRHRHLGNLSSPPYGSDRVPDPDDSSEPKAWKAQLSTKAKRRSLTSACESVPRSCLTPPTLLEIAIYRQLTWKRPSLEIGPSNTASMPMNEA